jgi:hypothetical protein
MLRLLAVSIAVSSAAASNLAAKPLRLRGGEVDVPSMVKNVGLVTSGFILLPAVRDMVSHTTSLLPGEEATRPLMMASEPKARNFMWGVWGLNHCALSWLKIQAIRQDDKPMLKFLFATAAASLGYLLKEKGAVAEAGGDVMGFVAVIGLQTASLGYLAFKNEP